MRLKKWRFVRPSRLAGNATRISWPGWTHSESSPCMATSNVEVRGSGDSPILSLQRSNRRLPAFLSIIRSCG
jgi:hypothetical protein